ncbi:MAG: HEAT repeat domain-containing protein [Deltaproteobacteria bacterium]|nr:HEAT repeat domain-containing protein [Deltaproteobacteria bacterium]
MSLEIPNYTTILIELNKAVKMHNFYPDGHPQLDLTVNKCYLLFKKNVEAQGEINWKIDQKGFYDDKNPIPGNAEIAGLAKKFFFRRIKELTFTPRISVAELKVLLSILRLEPEDLQDKGGPEAVFAEREVAGILINELRYEDLMKLKKELDERKDLERKELAQEKKKEEEAAGESQSAQEQKQQPNPSEHVEEAPLPALLQLFKDERDLLKYNDLSVRIKEKSDILLIEKKFDDLFPVYQVLIEHLTTLPRLPDDLRSSAAERLRSLQSRDMIQYLVDRLAAKEERSRGVINNVLLFFGEESAEILLDAIVDAQDALTRRNYFNLLVRFGRRIRLQVEKRLSSRQWFVVRQMIALLGELGDPASLDAVEDAYRNTDVRVKKEVLKSLVKISTPRATAMLINTLKEEDQSLVAQAIISLGALRDASVIDILGEIAVKREPFADNQEPKKEAIKALGAIANEKAVPYLTKILFKKVWFGKKSNEEIRAMAAYSLALIGTAEAYKAIEEAKNSAEGELYMACKRILEGREKK